ncbi:PREDICTED: glucocorticoid-induced transcript 1 protein-like isoform X3 [Dinoponera quadriceps]|uniref:Glucocorticoid-induced transcript 1 protein-like isoform X3 n=1 Tax=Dinoponera quadriceps TaxID=609295 RepID=A0A6P3Y921_DINQU|nr:PREDICTED: glucocorticoid-induced transcript 1 protein-like isoform X3 [Dinoponera quadriceps]
MCRTETWGITLCAVRIIYLRDDLLIVCVSVPVVRSEISRLLDVRNREEERGRGKSMCRVDDRTLTRKNVVLFRLPSSTRYLRLLVAKSVLTPKSKTLSGRCSDSLSGSQSIRRTASLDTIYLKGQWPRDSYYLHSSLLLVDKSTQTEEWSNEPRKMHPRHPTDQTTTDEKLEKYFRHRLQRTNKEGTSSRERTAAFGLIMPGGPPPALPGDHSVLLPSIASQTSMHNQFSLSTKASPMNIPMKPIRPPMRSSIEGLNQEIEGLVLKSVANTSDADHPVEDKYARYREQITPEGHRAPLADLLRATRSVNTQTPATDLPSSSYSSGPPSRNSESPLIPGLMDASRPPSDLLQGGSRGSTPEQDREGRLGTSPHINRFLAREPPDGCEKVNLKFVEEARRPKDLSKLDYCPKPCVPFQLKPSLGSAFLPLQQPASPTMVASASPSAHTTPTTPPPNP